MTAVIDKADSVHVGAGSPQGGQFAPAGGSSSSSQQQQPPAKKPGAKPAAKPGAKQPAPKPGAKKPAAKPAAKKPAAKPGAKKPATSGKSGAELRQEAQNDLQQAKDLESQANSLRSQIATLKQKLSNLYHIQNTGTSTSTSKPSSSSSTGSSSSAGTASTSGSSTTGSSTSGSSGSSTSGSSSSSSSSSTAAQISSTQSQISSLQSQLQSKLSQAGALRAQAAQLMQQAAKKSQGSTMTADVIEKAATLTGSGELTFFSFPIEKTETNEDGDVVVYGKATDGSVDSDEQIVDPDFSSKAIQTWLNTGGNLRVQHNPQRDPAGVGISAEPGPDGSQWVKSLVIEPVAKRLVQKGALRAYSVGIAKPIITRDGVARGGRITGGQIVEISLVDRPANKNCGIQLVKAASDGTPEWVGKVFGADDVIAKMAGTGTVQLELPEDVQIAFTPADMERILNHKRDMAEKRQQSDGTVVDSSGRDTTSLSDDDYAGPNKTFPIVNQGDVSDAASLAHHADDPGAVRSRIRSIAQRKFGMKDDDLPPSLKMLITKEDGGDDDGDDGGENCELCNGSGKILEGNRKCPDCGGSGKKTVEAEVTKDWGSDDGASGGDGGPKCSLCKGSGKIREGHVTCPKCKGDGKMSPADSAAEKAAQDEAERLAIREALLASIEKKKGTSGMDEGLDDDSDDDAEDPDAEDDDSADDDKSSKARRVTKGKVGDGDGGDDDDDDGSDADDTDGDEQGGSHDDDGGEAASSADGGGDSPGKKVATPGLKKKKVSCPKCAVKMKKPSAYCPGCGTKMPVAKSVQPSPKSKPLPAHREPDGKYIESFEHDAGLPTSRDSLEMKTAKKQRALGVSAEFGALHDLLCPAFTPGVAEKCHPGFTIDGLIDPMEWRRIAIDKATTAPIQEALRAQTLWQSAETLKAADPALVADLLLEANKAYSDANPGPGTAPTPDSGFSPGRFKRPLLTDGHQAPSPGHSGPNSAPVPTGTPSAADYQRDYLTAGHARQSPSSSNPNPGAPLVPSSLSARTTDLPNWMQVDTGKGSAAPAVADGKPKSTARQYYSHAARDNAKQSMQVLHDHIAHTFPDLCPMSSHAPEPVAEAMQTPEPNDVPAVKAGNGKIREPKVRRILLDQLEDGILKGALTLEEAQDILLKSIEPQVTKAAVTETPVNLEDTIQGAVEKAVTPLLRKIKKLEKQLDEMAELPDPRQQAMAMKGVMMQAPPAPQYQTPAAPAGMPSMSEYADRTQFMMLQQLEEQYRAAWDSSEREALWNQITKMRGITR